MQTSDIEFKNVSARSQNSKVSSAKGSRKGSVKKKKFVIPTESEDSESDVTYKFKSVKNSESVQKSIQSSSKVSK